MIVTYKTHIGITAINLDNVLSIDCEEYQGANYGIYFNFIDNHGIMVANYPKQKAIEIYTDLIEKWAGGGCSYYKMP